MTTKNQWYRTRGGLLKLLYQVVGIICALGVWELLTKTQVLDPVAVPTVSSAFSTLGQALVTSHLWIGVAQTLEGMAIGFVLGAVGGILLGVLIGVSRLAYRSCFLVIEFCKTIPVIAVLPLAVLVFGTSLKMKVLLVVFGVFFPMAIQTMYGVKAVDPVVRDTARVFSLKRRLTFTSVTIPSAAPFIATGLRLGVTAALLLDVLAEIVAGGSGVGLQILEGEAGGAIAYTYALILVTGVLGVLLVVGTSMLERRTMRWHELHRAGARP